MTHELEQLEQMVRALRHRRVAVLTGAGCSTESGIPDYRGPRAPQKPRRPIQYLQFVRSEMMRRRYWARSFLGWRLIARAVPNAAHHALAELERTGAVTGIVTQNVDNLHRAAGSLNVVELHGSLHRVVCLECGREETRQAVQTWLAESNPGFDHEIDAMRPDGDAELSEAAVKNFRVPACRDCDGVLKPRVVFFGENVPPPTLAAARAITDDAEVLWVIGSSLSVFSGFRFVRWARERGQGVVITNVGPTRGDGLATIKVECLATQAVPFVHRALFANDSTAATIA